MSQRFRLAQGGLIDRTQPLSFSFDGRTFSGHAGDTLASALLANGVHLVARSFKYHRPRGIVGHGAEDPGALLTLAGDGWEEPNVRATQTALMDGLRARSQNCWPGVSFDLGAVSNLLSRLLPAGFYYKTFMWPAPMWKFYERLIRAAAGLGRAPAKADPARHVHRHAHCDVLVGGGGPAGLAAALGAARAGASVMLVEQDCALGGRLLSEAAMVDGIRGNAWAAGIEAELRGMPNVRVLLRSVAFGYFDHNLLGIEEQTAGESTHAPARRLWKVRAARIVLATGALERPLVFANNDLPGTLLAHSAQSYVIRHAVLPGRRAVVFTNNDSAYAAAFDLVDAGIDALDVVDVRAEIPAVITDRAARAGINIHRGAAIVRARGANHVAAVDVATIDGEGRPVGAEFSIGCDLVCVSGGWNPTVHLFSQSRGKLRFDKALLAFVPEVSAQAEQSAGAARGVFGLDACIADGRDAGLAAARAAGFTVAAPSQPAPVAPDAATAPAPWWVLNDASSQREKCFVDLHNDVTVADIRLAAREGYASVEHLKRYTTLGMGTDQGKLSNVIGLAILAQSLGAEPGAAGTTTFRPPYSPVSFGALAGPGRGAHAAPLRRSAMDAWHEAAGAGYVNVGLWRRPRCYPQPGESDADALRREALAVREKGGLVDVSTLGKIDIKGRDAVEFLERVYINRWKSLAVGKVRYGVMLREDGMAWDDGTTARLSENHYLMTTTTANAVAVMSRLEKHLQVEWPELQVTLTSVTDHWAAMALAGPCARATLERIAPEQDWSNEGFAHLSLRECRIRGVEARVFRISYSGETAYEINVPADYGAPMWEALLAAGREFGLAPYGTEAMGTLRIEKGHIAASEINGRTTPGDLGLAQLMNPAGRFIGGRALSRPALAEADRKQLVGLLPKDGRTPIPPGAQLLERANATPPTPIVGHVTTNCWSPNLRKPIALALLAAGRSRIGQTLWAASPLAGAAVEVIVTPHVHYDPEGSRVRA